jgi:hypothetical protein
MAARRRGTDETLAQPPSDEVRQVDRERQHQRVRRPRPPPGAGVLVEVQPVHPRHLGADRIAPAQAASEAAQDAGQGVAGVVADHPPVAQGRRQHGDERLDHVARAQVPAGRVRDVLGVHEVRRRVK